MFATASSRPTAGRAPPRSPPTSWRGAVSKPASRVSLVTSTARDGSLGGPDLDLLGEVLPCGLPVIAAGGISSLEDLVAVRDAGCEAAVAGSALLSRPVHARRSRRGYGSAVSEHAITIWSDYI